MKSRPPGILVAQLVCDDEPERTNKTKRLHGVNPQMKNFNALKKGTIAAGGWSLLYSVVQRSLFLMTRLLPPWAKPRDKSLIKRANKKVYRKPSKR